MKHTGLLLIACFLVSLVQAQTVRERINFDDDWYFAFGHPTDKSKDFNTGTSYFTYLAKARYGGDGATTLGFDHRPWRKLNVPHDWAVEMPFDAKGSHSHGYKAVGPGFPDVSVGWYRKVFLIDSLDLGKQIFLDFDGVSRDSKVWVNGHYLGNEPSGYQSFSYNISDILNYGSENIVAVRADVSMEEGWYYEGAGIYRHVWLRKTPNVHIPKDGTFVHSQISENSANITVEADIANNDTQAFDIEVRHLLKDANGNTISTSEGSHVQLEPMGQTTVKANLSVEKPQLWSLDNPYMHSMVTQLLVDGNMVDEYTTPFGIRSVHFDSDKGFFLNGEHIKLKGTNNHQDHAGVGCAMPDDLIRWRIQQLKNFGSNAIRSSHNPPTPELLQLCDEMGMLVIDENRLMGTTEKALHELERLIRRDRNHPSVIVWSIGNEEWGIEWNDIGARMTQTMQNYAKQIDPTRPINVAVSGGWGDGSSTTVEVMGFNYLVHGDTDEYHKRFPNTPCIGTEEGSTYTTRGVYEVDDEKQYKTAYDVIPLDDWFTIQECWKHYYERDYLAGMFIWTGFDYRGESTPYTWPSVTSYFGMMDLCGFPKDNVYYLKSWWQNKEDVLHLLPHWNWQGREGDIIDVWAYSNAEEVELWLNGRSLGKKQMELNGHLTWDVPYEAGSIKAVSYKNGQEVMVAERVTTGSPASIQLSNDKSKLNNKGVSMVSVEVLDENGNAVPTADNLIHLEIEGPGQIIGVGNGNPTSVEKEVFVDDYQQLELPDAQVLELNADEAEALLATLGKKDRKRISKLSVVSAMSASFELNQLPDDSQTITWFYHHVGESQQIYINGHLLSAETLVSNGLASFVINNEWLSKGKNDVLIITKPFEPKHKWDNPNKKPGVIQVITKAENNKRRLFNGLAQVIIQASGEAGEITLKAKSEGLEAASLKINVE
ncbi:DUF4982 domain-containing protein [Carboxylicivirga sp. A043]|uniref:beta-galactosidase GalA n=1 Tax=Carboxylicivirga litoralis TaxID=2816963 RepID=UPI0021CB1D69|nr:beta-galactosidase GalA [Carboxylicivirga sp. A043]MCU4155626.1 DUF4982 domain-containing protein [Carboxylicivirga sp. A043]